MNLTAIEGGTKPIVHPRGCEAKDTGKKDNNLNPSEEFYKVSIDRPVVSS